MNNDTGECSICGVCIGDKYVEELICGHTYHYECLLCSFIEIHKHSCKYNYVNRCPYCRRASGLLPVVNGLTKMTPMIHYKIHGVKPVLENKSCQGILKSGKNKGSLCNKKCQLGYEYCKRHL